MRAVIAAVLCLSVAPISFAEGDKNRLGDDDITSSYQLCQQQGVQTVTISSLDEDGSGEVIVIDCDEIPGPDYQRP